MASIASGTTQVENGTIIGATDFSEFSLGVGIPVGITQFGLGADAPDAFSVGNDVLEGNFFSMGGHGAQAWAFGLNAFAGKIEFGEMLARISVNLAGSGGLKTNIGPVLSLSGLIGIPEVGPDLDFSGGGIHKRTAADFESQVWKTNDGSGSIPAFADLQEAEQQGSDVWAWMRVKRTENGGDAARDDGEITTWYGDITDEPVAPDVTYAAAAGPNIRGLGALGWGIQQFGATGDMRIAFLSFTGDTALASAPIPSELKTSWLSCSPTPGTVWSVCT